MSTTTIARQQPAADHSLLVIERILRDREGIWDQIKSEYRLNALIGQMIASATAALACYRMVLGFSNGPLQALASAIKLPVLFFLTLAICLPKLYFVCTSQLCRTESNTGRTRIYSPASSGPHPPLSRAASRR